MNKLILGLLSSLLLLSACKSTEENQHPEKAEIKEVVVESIVDIEIVDEEIASLKIQQDIDTLTVEGTLISIGESDFWGRIYLTLDIAGEKRSFTYLTYSIDRNKEVEKLMNKKVSLAYYSEVTIEEVDIHFKGAGIHGEYSSVQKEEDIRNYGNNTIEGIITVTTDDISGDLPSSYWMTKSDGSKVEVVAFIYADYILHNGEKATVYFRERHKNLVVSIDVITEEESTTAGLFIGQWKKENAENPIDPTGFKIYKNDDNDYSITFRDDIAIDLPNLAHKSIKGENTLGNFTLELISENPLVISYSDDGRGHFDPVVNERFVKVK